MMEICFKCGGETYSANSINKCIECGANIDNVEAKPAGNDDGNANTEFSSIIREIKEGVK